MASILSIASSESNDFSKSDPLSYLICYGSRSFILRSMNTISIILHVANLIGSTVSSVLIVLVLPQRNLVNHFTITIAIDGADFRLFIKLIVGLSDVCSRKNNIL